MATTVIVGAGECGVRAAFALREAGFDGAISLFGEEPHLPYERPPLSKGQIETPKIIAAETAFANAGIELKRNQHVASIDRENGTVRLEDGSSVRYETLLITTGARPRVPAGIGGALTLRTLDDARAILSRIEAGSRLAVIGGGFIGLELAAVARGKGAQVTVVEAADRLMGRAVPAEIAAVAEARHRDEGVEIVLSAAVVSVHADEVRLADGRAIACDLVVAGVGAVPNTGLAETAGLAVENGIVVNDSFRTADPAIFAAGDCCAFPYRARRVRLESWRAAQDHGNHVARAMLGEEEPYAKVPWFWSDQYDLTLQVAGLPDPALPFVRRDLDQGAFLLFQQAADGTLLSASGIGTGNAIARDVRLAEMMIEREIKSDPAQLADPAVRLKSLLKG